MNTEAILYDLPAHCAAKVVAYIPPEITVKTIRREQLETYKAWKRASQTMNWYQRYLSLQKYTRRGRLLDQVRRFGIYGARPTHTVMRPVAPDPFAS